VRVTLGKEVGFLWRRDSRVLKSSVKLGALVKVPMASGCEAA